MLSLKSDLIAAVQKNDIELATKLIPITNLDFRDKNRKTALFYASENGNLEICKLLINNGANMYIKDDRGLMAIHYALFRSKTDIIDYFVERNFNISIKKLELDIDNLSLHDKRFFLRLIKRIF